LQTAMILTVLKYLQKKMERGEVAQDGRGIFMSSLLVSAAVVKFCWDS